MTYYVPGTQEKDPTKVIMSLQQAHEKTATNTTDIATNTADIATNAADIAANTADIATNTAAIAKLTNNQFARVCLTADQSGISSATDTLISFDTTSFDPSSIWNNTTKRFVPTVAGYYTVNLSVQISWASGNSSSFLFIRKNGARNSMSNYTGASFAASSVVLKASDIIHLNGTTDYIDAIGNCDGTATRTIIGTGTSGDRTFMTIQLVKAD